MKTITITKKIKILMICLVSIIAIGIMPYSASAADINSKNESIYNQNSRESESVFEISPEMQKTEISVESGHELSSQLRNEIAAEIKDSPNNDSNPVLRSSSAHGGSQWKTEYGTTSTRTASGYAGNQLPGGYKMPAGGQIWYSPDGGSSVSIGASFPTPFGPLSLNVNLGTRSGSVTALSAPVPDSTHYYRLWVVKTYEIRPYVTYNKKNNKWVVYSKGLTSKQTKLALSMKKVS